MTTISSIIARSGRKSFIRPGILLALALALIPGLGVGRGVAAAEEPEIEGATASRDYFAPADLVVIDAVATARQRASAGELLPIVVRRDDRVVDGAVGRFNTAFAQARQAFGDAIEAEFGRRVIDSQEINSARFRALRNNFRASNPTFPVHVVLAQTWASGRDGDATRSRLAGALRAVLQQYSIGEFRRASSIYVVEFAPDERMRNWGEVAAHATRIDRTAVIGVDEAGRELRRLLDPLDRMAAGYVAGLIQPNLVPDPYLTGLLLQERLGEEAVNRHYAVGAPIVLRGGVFDRWSVLAIEAYRRHGMELLDTLPRPAPVATTTTSADGSAPPKERPGREPVATPMRNSSWLTVGAVLGGAAALVLVLLAIRAFRHRVRRRPRPVSAQQLEILTPEQPADLRTALLPHLAREMKDRLVQVLFAHRRALLENEEEAARRMQEMEDRIARLQPALLQRIRAYEQRIETLERELTEKDEETRDLLRARLVLARQELETEIARGRRDWNSAN